MRTTQGCCMLLQNSSYTATYKMLGEKARWELHKDAACCFKTAAIQLLTKCLEKKLDENYTRMLHAASKQQLYSYLKMLGEKARWELHKDAACCFKTAAIQLLTKCLEKKLDENYTRMLHAASKQQLYSYLQNAWRKS